MKFWNESELSPLFEYLLYISRCKIIFFTECIYECCKLSFCSKRDYFIKDFINIILVIYFFWECMCCKECSKHIYGYFFFQLINNFQHFQLGFSIKSVA